MIKTDYIKECLSMYFRLGLAALATLVVTLGGTIRLIIADVDAAAPGTVVGFATLGVDATVLGTMISFTALGFVASVILLLISLCFVWLTHRTMRHLKSLTETSNV